jgi:dipeptidyl aminopeptidase/acylaminoacyl peptidase
MGRFVAAVLVATAAAALAAPAAHATWPGRNGSVAYFRTNSQEESDELVMVDPVTGAFKQIAGGINYDPSWSPDGHHLVAVDLGYIFTMDVANGGGAEISQYGPDGFSGRWSPDGTQLYYVTEYPCCDLHVINGDGTNDRLVMANDGASDWSPDGTKLAIGAHPAQGIATINSGGTGYQQLTTGPDSGATWRPDGQKIAFDSTRGPTGIYLMNPDGSGQAFVTDGTSPQWSPDGTRIAFTRNDGDAEIYVMNADGSGIAKLTDNTDDDVDYHWSPDGTKLAFTRYVGMRSFVYTMNADGTNQIRLDTEPGYDSWDPDWQPIPVTTYPRPKGATPMYLSFVPAYAPCTTPNNTHGAPLAFGSCAPPTRTSSSLTVGTPDSNGKPAKSVASALVRAKPGDPSTPANEADVRFSLDVTDVRNANDLSDYSGALEARPTLRITDRDNTPSPGGPGAATVSDLAFPFSVPCTPTGDTTIGAACHVDTSANAVLPGSVVESRRSIWALQRFDVRDGDGNAFLTEGLFVP